MSCHNLENKNFTIMAQSEGKKFTIFKEKLFAHFYKLNWQLWKWFKLTNEWKYQISFPKEVKLPLQVKTVTSVSPPQNK